MLLHAYATHRAPPALDFPHRLNHRRDRSDWLTRFEDADWDDVGTPT